MNGWYWVKGGEGEGKDIYNVEQRGNTDENDQWEKGEIIGMRMTKQKGIWMIMINKK
jgi:hypothetical protein